MRVVGGGRRGEMKIVREQERIGRSELASEGLDLYLDPDPWNILWIRIRQNVADPLDPDP